MTRRLHASQKALVSGKIFSASMDQCLQSYLGILSHANQHDLAQVLKNAYLGRTEQGLIPYE